MNINISTGAENGYENITIKNCNIYENSSGLNGTAIFFGTDSSDSTILIILLQLKGMKLAECFLEKILEFQI